MKDILNARSDSGMLFIVKTEEVSRLVALLAILCTEKSLTVIKVLQVGMTHRGTGKELTR